MKSREEAVLRKCQYFASIGVWPTSDRLRPHAWLDNFAAPDRPLAVELLDAFVYYNAAQVRAVFKHALHQLRNTMRQAGVRWADFDSRMVVTYPPGETPNITDSGHVFARLARSVGVPEQRLLPPERALDFWMSDGRPVVFVDDFVGSGSQMRTAWRRSYLDGGVAKSFESAWTVRSAPVYYCCAFATTFGVSQLGKHNIPVKVVCPYVLGPKDSVMSADSRLLSPDTLLEVQDMVKRVSQDQGWPDTGGMETNDWQGFAQLGLSIGIDKGLDHGMPDASLPIFRDSLNGWKPLL